MDCTSPHHRTARSCRPARHIVALLVGIAAVGGLTEAASAAPAAPAAIAGDPHSPRVAAHAAAAVETLDTLHKDPTDAAEAAYVAARDRTAAATAAELAVSPARLKRAWAEADLEHQTAVLAALTQLGVEYRSNTSEPFVGFDCSGLTTYAWGEAGVELSRQSGSQISEAAERTMDTAMAGDLAQYPGHVMMYLGVDGAMVHASNPQNDVELWMLGDRSVRWGDPTE